jgi:DNA-binding transcriptional MerR regulator
VDVLTPAEVAEMTRLPVQTLKYFRTRGGGPQFFTLGRKVVYSKDDVVEWLTAQRAAGKTRAGAVA